MGASTEPGGSSRSDKEWERFLRESAAGAADAPKEPSARAREVAKRLREEPDRGPEVWRSYTPAQPKRHKVWYVIGLVASLVVLALVILAPGRVADPFASEQSGSAPLAAETARPTQGPAEETAQRPTKEEPFRGSPAASWANGAAGITVPEAQAVGWMGTAEVERALASSRDFLVASSLDRTVLRGEHPAKAIALINPHQKDVRELLETAFQTPNEKNDPLLLFSRFQPSRTQLVGDVVKTRGQLTYREGERGALQVTADVTFVYPVTRANAGGDDEIVRTIVRRELVLSWDDPAKVITKPGTFSVISYKYHVTNGGCDPSKGYLAPPFGKDHRSDETGMKIDPYDRSAPVGGGDSSGDGCGKATRS
ncbi:hypothetical protein QEZ40_004522 [Streptomyces katrae]|uniref:Uncharacterized protein n=1 Tax=Streptomyces katrae TaxID=68223 RepID=A0ABT7GNM6_9ACTN|nr:hypothetical protein [Streptomyces katrae]MDK9495088.1 hypothetical protein [Streptomyces katrae]